MGKSRNIIYIIYTNPFVYPPLQHSAQILKSKGWGILFLGTELSGYNKQSRMKGSSSDIKTKLLRFQEPGIFQKIHYANYCLWVLLHVLVERPGWIYASDSLVSPLAWLLSKIGCKVIYHEHDSPDINDRQTLWGRMILRFRKMIAFEAKVCVLPNKKRADFFSEQTGRKEVLTIWNCPAVLEVTESRSRGNQTTDIVGLYQGSIVPTRLPLSLLEALAVTSNKLKLRIVGYETVGHRNYLNLFIEKAKALKVDERIEIIGFVESRAELLSICRKSDFGLGFMPIEKPNINMQYMIGASNKPFEYLACGLALLVTDLPDWNAMYVRPGYGLSCDPRDSDSIARAFKWFLDHPDEMMAMGEMGRQRIHLEWNYEAQFEPVLKIVNCGYHGLS